VGRIASPYLGWVWVFVDSPDIWGQSGGSGWVPFFLLSFVRAVTRLSARRFEKDMRAPVVDATNQHTSSIDLRVRIRQSERWKDNCIIYDLTKLSLYSRSHIYTNAVTHIHCTSALFMP
jgi:hypothetical protein